MNPIVRDATAADLEAIRAIYNEAVANTTASYDYDPRSAEAQRLWFETKEKGGHPVLVAEAGGQVLGYASYGPYRPWAGYLHSVEHSVYVDAAARGKGLGRALLAELVDRAEAQGLHVMIGGIDAANVASIALHAGLGFTECGIIREVGWKFGRWLDLLFMQKILAARR